MSSRRIVSREPLVLTATGLDPGLRISGVTTPSLILNAVIPAGGYRLAYGGGSRRRPLDDRDGKLPAGLNMNSALCVMAVPQIIVSDNVFRCFSKKIEILGKKNVPPDRGHPD